ncbi:MAG TPA: DUF4426 domain-containing protein [Lysobacter sp.]|nr:DUF4426 domain-containing protein [Lysobacter sp.]
MAFPFSIARARLVFTALLAVALTAACSGSPPPPRAAGGATQSATVRSGDVTIRASAVPTSTLGAAVAAEYGIQRGDDTVLLLVALRKGAEGQEVSIPAQVRVTVTDLSGQRQDLPMRELRSGDLLDYIGTVDVSAPDTLRFDLQIVREGGEVSSMQFTREFHPR